MSDSPSSLFDVLIAGAGPVGLFLACELRLAGVSVLVLERAGDTRSPLKQLPFGLRGLSVPTVEALDRRGLLEAIRALQATRDTAGAAHWMQQARRPAGHFAGIQFFEGDVDSARWPYRLPGPADAGMAVDMETFEAVLAARAKETGADIRYGLSVEGVEDAGEEVTVRAGGERFRGGWLVGCDGGRSSVRRLAGFGFTGTDPEFTGYSVEVELADPEALPAGRHYTPTGMYTYARPGTIAMVDFDGGAHHRGAPVAIAHVEAVLRRVSGVAVTLNGLRLATTWTDRACQATRYRNGRVLLAGDAAHIHSPLGGQGLNLGLGDAMNLGWKLAATIRGEAPGDLLDSYQAERHPAGARILDWSRAQVAILRPTPSSRALEAILRDLIATRDGATYFAERVSGISLCYDLGAGHPLVGRSVPDFRLRDGVRVGTLLREGRGLLLDFAPDAPLRALAGRWGDRVAYAAGEAEAMLGLKAVLVRPDGFVAWASDDAPDLAGVATAATRWFGAPV